jgi:hypothetical protein
MEQMKTTRREILLAAIALAVPTAVVGEEALRTTKVPKCVLPETEVSSAPVLYKRGHCRGGWTLVSGTL